MFKTLITPKINPDLDGVACAYAYSQFLNKTQNDYQYIAGIYGRPQIEARFLLERLNLEDGLCYNPQNDFFDFIIVDASDIKGMPEIIQKAKVKEVIDHRLAHQAYELFPQAKIQIEMVGAAATLILEKFIENSLFPSEEIMLMLGGAIFSNTLNFKAEIVSNRDKKAIEYIKKNVSPLAFKMISEQMFIYKTEYLKNNLSEVIKDDFKVFNFPGNFGIAQIEGYDLDNLLIVKREELIIILQELKKKNNLDHIFLTAADINNSYNIFLAIDKNTEKILKTKMNLVFNSGIARNSKLLLRKQIVPLLIN
ncbi:MAG: DHH family phosphoesterase [Planctomycetes bacterium]|jgi:inorganic pyrophosphatase/exopolyphosphatase|nr:DHH family phosphoesterase [Planctomycetota bacterium]